jgi:ribonucleoside-diphosphate reductase alpha chain
VSRLSAREVFSKIVEAAWKTGEPGIVFLDRLNRDNAVPSQGEIEATNPCGEQPLLPYESCNLGSINLTAMLTEGEDCAIDWDKLEKTVAASVHFLDNVIDANRYPLDIIAQTTLKTRKIGLGVMGWADMLLKLGIPYDSEEAVQLAEELMGFINEKAKFYSAKLAETRGAFPLFSESIYKDQKPLRNATATTIAPTGTLSIIAGVSSGIEPVFGYVYVRNVMDGTELLEVNPILKEVLTARGLYSEELMRAIIEQGGPKHVDSLPEDIKRVFVSAHDVTPEWHIRMQAAFQKHIDNAVSKTVNFPKDASAEDVADVYRLAFKLGCKGVTVYRDGSREEQVLNLGAKKVAKTEDESLPLPIVRPRERPEITTGFTERVRIGCGNLYITINYDEKGICEVFTNTGKKGGCPSQSEATARLATAALRSGVDPACIVEQLRGIRCPSTVSKPDMKALSCPDAISRVLSKVLNLQNHETNGNGHSVKDLSDADDNFCSPTGSMKSTAKCPECGKPMQYADGCVICRFCGYSKCG